jgi:hypothetical protein
MALFIKDFILDDLGVAFFWMVCLGIARRSQQPVKL